MDEGDLLDVLLRPPGKICISQILFEID